MSTMPQAEKEYILSAMPGFDDLLLKVLWNTMTKNNGLQEMDPDVLRAFYDEFTKRPGVLESTESEIRGRMGMEASKMTESQLRKRIRKVILEARPRKNPRHTLQTHPGIGIMHGDSSGVNCDFNSSAYQLLHSQVYDAMPTLLRYSGEWTMPDGGDGYRFINQILQCRDEETGMIMYAVYCVDRANSENATKTSYDVYVLDYELIKDNHRNMDRDLSSDSRRWAKKGEYCTNVQQICDTLDDAHTHLQEEGII